MLVIIGQQSQRIDTLVVNHVSPLPSLQVGQKEKVGDNLYLVTAKRMTGDVASFRDIARRLLLKL